MTIPKTCKRLAEVDFPIAEVSKHSAREKSIRHGHPSTLHLWWARRPLASCRAMLMALLLPDPCDDDCPDAFKAKGREVFRSGPGANRWPSGWKQDMESDKGLRKVLLKFIADFANWDNSAVPAYLETARALVKAAHPDETPLVVDPFAGGGSIPLEALRVGCEAFASDLNPVACLILKVMLEDIPRHGPGLADELRRVGAEVKKAAEKELKRFYPDDPDGAKPIAYLWARTVRCEAPKCGAEIPLARSFWLSKKAKRRRALRYEVKRPRGKTPYLKFSIFEPTTDREIPPGTVDRAKAKCPCCGSVLPAERTRAQLSEQRGGADVVFDRKGKRNGGAFMTAVVTLKPDEKGRHYRLPTARDYEAIWKAQKRLRKVAAEKLPNGLSPVPDEPLPKIGTLGFRVQRYGMLHWGDLFTSRQSLALATLAKLTQAVTHDSANLGELLALTLNHTTERCSTLCRWSPEPYMETILGVFGRHALPMIWDFAEAAVLSESTGSYLHGLRVKTQAVADALRPPHAGQVQLADSRRSPLPDGSAATWFTDPPYYDAIPYSDLSDFFYVWLKRALPADSLLGDPFDPNNSLTPKTQEAVQDTTKSVDGMPKDGAFFERAMGLAFAQGRRVLADDGIGSVVFAHKTTEGWEALLSGMIQGGWVIVGSWPIATERPNRLRSQNSAALATSVHLVCRPRDEDAGVGDWGDVLRELPGRVGDWMERLQEEGVRGADLVFACIGPALEIYSRYSRVEDAEGREIPLGGDPEATDPHERGFLAYVWETVGRQALEQVLGTAEAKARNGAAGAVEEDARLTALFLWTLQSTENGNGGKKGQGSSDAEDEDAPAKKRSAGFSLPFDVVRRFAQPLGIHLDDWEGRIVGTEKGIVKLIPIADRAEQLFGDAGAEAVAAQMEKEATEDPQMLLFPEAGAAAPKVRGRRGGKGRRSKRKRAGVSDTEFVERRKRPTTLDRIHAAMLLQAGGRYNALKALIRAEQDRGPDFVRLSNALSALYPAGSEEKRLVDAMLLAVPR